MQKSWGNIYHLTKWFEFMNFFLRYNLNVVINTISLSAQFQRHFPSTVKIVVSDLQDDVIFIPLKCRSCYYLCVTELCTWKPWQYLTDPIKQDMLHFCFESPAIPHWCDCSGVIAQFNSPQDWDHVKNDLCDVEVCFYLWDWAVMKTILNLFAIFWFLVDSLFTYLLRLVCFCLICNRNVCLLYTQECVSLWISWHRTCYICLHVTYVTMCFCHATYFKIGMKGYKKWSRSAKGKIFTLYNCSLYKIFFLVISLHLCVTSVCTLHM